MKYLFLIAYFISSLAWADDFRPASLTIQPIDESNFEVVWKRPIKNRQLPQLNVIFDSFSKEQLPKRSRTIEGSYVQSWRFFREQGVSGLMVTIEGLEGSSYEVILRIPAKDTNESGLTKILNTDYPSFIVPESQTLRTSNVMLSYIDLGFTHILAGLDHLLFVFALILLVVGRKKLIWTVTSFTLAHSITLAAVTLDWFHLPGAPVEAVIALSIIFLAKEIITVHHGKVSFTAQYPWIVAFIFGLLHGMGFAGALAEIGVPANEVVLALLSFNIGVELGQLTFVAVMLLLITLANKLLFTRPNWVQQLPAYAIGTTASFWLLQRLLVF